MTSPKFPSRITFGSLLQYSARGDTPAALRSKNIILGIKVDRVSHKPPRLIGDLVIEAMARDFEKQPLVEILNTRVTLVPMPRSAPLLQRAVWVLRTICEQLVAHGLAREWQPLVERIEAIDKSACFKNPSARPSPFRHYETMNALFSTVAPDELVLVDDVVTKGATFAGAAARLMEVYPGVLIRAFAISRAESNFDKIQDPMVGEIEVAADGSKIRRNDHPSGLLF